MKILRMHDKFIYIKKMIKSIVKRYGNTRLSTQLDQVVALILKNNQVSPLSLFYLQRNYFKNDPYSGDLCFPGGHRQKGETPLETAIRETQEETAINLNKKGRFLGMIDQAFFTKVKISKETKEPKRYHLGVMLFELEDEVQVQLNEEMRDYRWIPFERFVNGSTSDLTYFRRNMKGYFKGLSSQKEIEKISFPALNIGMQKDLWGLTFATTGVFIREMVKIHGLDGLRREGFEVCEDYWKKYEKHSLSVKVEYRNGEQEEKPFESVRKGLLEGKGI